MLLGDRLDSLDLRRWLRRPVAEPVTPSGGESPGIGWRCSRCARAVPVAVAIVALLVALGAPSWASNGACPTIGSCRTSSSSHRGRRPAAHPVRADCAKNRDHRHPGRDRHHFGAARRLRCRAVAGFRTCRRCRRRASPSSAAASVGPPTAATGITNGSAFLTVTSTAPLFSQASGRRSSKRLQAVPGPGGQARVMPVDTPGQPGHRRAIASRLPLVLAIDRRRSPSCCCS